MTRTFRTGTYLLAASFALGFLFSGGIAKADGMSDGHHDSKWSDDKDGEYKSDFKHFKEDEHSNGWLSDRHDHDRDDNDGGWSGNGGKPGDPDKPGTAAVAEPSTLALLSVGMLGLFAFVRRQNRSQQIA
jgi:hypothetical protein